MQISSLWQKLSKLYFLKDKKELNDTGQTKMSNDNQQKEDWDKELSDELHVRLDL